MVKPLFASTMPLLADPAPPRISRTGRGMLVKFWLPVALKERLVSVSTTAPERSRTWMVTEVPRLSVVASTS